jgi:hypothetical protein
MDRKTEWGEGVFALLDELLEGDLHSKRTPTARRAENRKRRFRGFPRRRISLRHLSSTKVSQGIGGLGSRSVLSAPDVEAPRQVDPSMYSKYSSLLL